MAKSVIKKPNVIYTRSNRIEVTIPAKSVVTVGVINELIDYPPGYTLEGVTLISESDGNCIPFLRTNNNVLFVYARNFNETSQIVTGIYIRALFVRA